MTLQAYVAKAAPPLSDAWLASLFVPAAGRDRVGAVLAYAAEIDACVRNTHEPAVAALKLAWWRDEVELLAAGVPRHPIAIAAAQSTRLRGAPDAWLALLASAQRALEHIPHPSSAAFEAHCTEAAARDELLALALDADESMRRRARSLGEIAARVRLLMEVPAATADGRVLLPVDVLAAAGVVPEETAIDLSPAVRDVTRRLVREALDALDAALAAASGHPLVPGAIMAALQGARSERTIAEAGAGAAPRPFTRLLIAWRTARHCARGQ